MSFSPLVTGSTCLSVNTFVKGPHDGCNIQTEVCVTVCPNLTVLLMTEFIIHVCTAIKSCLSVIHLSQVCQRFV